MDNPVFQLELPLGESLSEPARWVAPSCANAPSGAVPGGGRCFFHRRTTRHE